MTLSRWTALLGCIVGLLILGLSIPRLGLNLALLPGNTVIETIEAGVLPPPAAFERSLDSRRDAAQWAETPETLADVGLLYYALAVAADPANPAYPQVLERAEGALNRSLAVNPANTHGWMQLAFIESQLERVESAASALVNSLRTGPNQPELLGFRTDLGLAVWPHLDPAERSLIEDDIGLAAAQDLINLAGTVRLAGQDEIAATVLRVDPALPPKLQRVPPVDIGGQMRLWTMQ